MLSLQHRQPLSDFISLARNPIPEILDHLKNNEVSGPANVREHSMTIFRNNLLVY